jgi:hypothetical protein
MSSVDILPKTLDRQLGLAGGEILNRLETGYSKSAHSRISHY